MLEISNLSVAFGDHRVLVNLSVDLESPAVHGLVGMNGAGKTTLMNTIAGFIRPGSGTVTFQGKPLTRNHLACMETENFFYSHITGREYLGLFSRKGDMAGIDELNQLFRLPLDKLTESYSSGMKRKLVLAAVLLQDKQLIILDEPFNGLDLESSRLLAIIIGRMKQRGKTVLVSSHILGSLTDVCDRIHLLRDGTIRISHTSDNFAGLEQDIFRDVDAGYTQLIKTIL